MKNKIILVLVVVGIALFITVCFDINFLPTLAVISLLGIGQKYRGKSKSTDFLITCLSLILVFWLAGTTFVNWSIKKVKSELPVMDTASPYIKRGADLAVVKNIFPSVVNAKLILWLHQVDHEDNVATAVGNALKTGDVNTAIDIIREEEGRVEKIKKVVNPFAPPPYLGDQIFFPSDSEGGYGYSSKFDHDTDVVIEVTRGPVKMVFTNNVSGDLPVGKHPAHAKKGQTLSFKSLGESEIKIYETL